MNPHRLRILVPLLALGTMLGACAGEPVKSNDTTPSPTASRRTTDLKMGATLTTALGNMITVHSFEYPAKTSATPPSPGEAFAAADIEACAGPTPDPNSGIGPTSFLLATDTQDGYQGQSAGVRKPPFNLTYLAPNGCTRGWVSFQFPQDQKPRYVILVSAAEIGRWKI